jgi:hypothetical protein
VQLWHLMISQAYFHNCTTPAYIPVNGPRNLPLGTLKWPGRTNGFNLIFFTELYMGCNPVIKMFRYSENTTMQEHNIHNQFPLSDCLRRFNSPTSVKRVDHFIRALLYILCRHHFSSLNLYWLNSSYFK